MADVELFNVLAFETQNESAVAITATTSGAPQTVITLTTAALTAGTYMLGYSFQVTHAAQNRPLFFKISGTYADAAYFVNESSGNNQLNLNRAYMYPKSHAGGQITLALDMYEATATATIDLVDVFVHRVA